MNTLGEKVRSNNESILLVCDINNEYVLFTSGTQFVNDMSPRNNEDVDLSGLDMKQVVTDKSGNPILPGGKDGSICDVNTFGDISLRPKMSCILKLKLNQVDDQSTFLNRNLNLKVEDLTFFIMVKEIMKILPKSYDEATRERNHKGNGHIDDVVNMNKEVHDGSEHFNEGVDLYNLPFFYEDIMLKWKH